MSDRAPEATGLRRRGLEVGRLRVLHPGPLRWLRALGWMVPLFILASVVNAAAGLPAEAALDGNSGPLPLALVALACLVGVGLYAGAVRLGEKRWPEELGLAAAPRDLAVGLVVGVVMFSLVMALLVLTGAYEIGQPRLANPMWALSMCLASGVTEELVMRAVVFRLIMRAFGVWPALVLSAALFGFMHLGNPNATPAAGAAIAIEAGLMLAGFYLLSGRLWMPIAVHFAWNFAQGYLFGAAVSGIKSPGGLLVSKPLAGVPDWLSGGAFGPEASVPALVVGSLAAVATLVWAGRRGNLRARADAAPVVISS
jgi:membrane protease YdiL (CAAX protease family)